MSKVFGRFWFYVSEKQFLFIQEKRNKLIWECLGLLIAAMYVAFVVALFCHISGFWGQNMMMWGTLIITMAFGVLFGSKRIQRNHGYDRRDFEQKCYQLFITNLVAVCIMFIIQKVPKEVWDRFMGSLHL